MSFKDTLIDHERSPEAQKWLDEEIVEQQKRYEAIVAEMESISDQREKWYDEFLERIQTYGFNADGDQRVKIPEDDIPVRPDAPHKVVY